jgi:hypothetical protein
MTTTAPLIHYFAWHRAHKRDRWVKVAEGNTYDEAWRELLLRKSKTGRHAESMVLSSNMNPNDYTRRRQSR